MRTRSSLARHQVVLSPEDAESDFKRIVGEMLRHDSTLGVNLWGNHPDPVMLLWSPRVYEFLQVLESVLSYQPARGLCREVGYRSGFEGARETAKSVDVAENDRGVAVLLSMPRVIGGSGWGVSELAYDEEKAEVAWRFPKGTAVGIAAGRLDPRSNPACAFFEGFGAGWVKGSVGLPVEFHEARCRGVRGDTCVFESRPLG